MSGETFQELLKRSLHKESQLPESYRTALEQKYPLSLIRPALAPHLFGAESRVSRTHGPSKQVFGLTFNRFLYRLISLVTRLMNLVPECSERGAEELAHHQEDLDDLIATYLKGEMTPHQLSLLLEGPIGLAVDCLQELVAYPEIAASEDLLTEINAAAYLLTLYKHGLERDGVFWFCVPAPDTLVLASEEDDAVQFRPRASHRVATRFFQQSAEAGSLEKLFDQQAFFVGLQRVAPGGEIVPKGFSLKHRKDGTPSIHWQNRGKMNNYDVG
jgi:hypothetical protein